MNWHDFNNPLLILAAVAVAVIGVGRIVRLVTWDDYPPTVAIRTWWVEKVTHDNGWAKLLTCLWCFAPWAMLVCLTWLGVGLLTGAEIIVAGWWLFFGWMALSYLASMLVRRDEPEE